MLRSLWVLILLWCLLRAGLLFLAVQGNTDPAAREVALAHFSAEDIARGRAYAVARSAAANAAQV